VNNYSVIRGEWKFGARIRVTIVNVYSYDSLRENKLVWDDISELWKHQKKKACCVVWDFNSITRKEERKDLIFVSDYNREISSFNNFIEKSKLLDIPIVDRKFTWYKLNGLVKSIIDRILVSRD